MKEANIPINCPSRSSERTVKDGSYGGGECNRRYNGRVKGSSPETKRFTAHSLNLLVDKENTPSPHI